MESIRELLSASFFFNFFCIFSINLKLFKIQTKKVRSAQALWQEKCTHLHLFRVQSVPCGPFSDGKGRRWEMMSIRATNVNSTVRQPLSLGSWPDMLCSLGLAA